MKYIIWYAMCYSYTRWDVGAFRTVDNPTLRQRRQGVDCYNKPLLTWTAEHEAKGPTTWTVTLEEQIDKHNHILKLPATVRLHHVFHVNNLRPCSTAPLRPAVPVIVPQRWSIIVIEIGGLCGDSRAFWKIGCVFATHVGSCFFFSKNR
jgi:hypothetical protein